MLNSIKDLNLLFFGNYYRRHIPFHNCRNLSLIYNELLLMNSLADADRFLEPTY